MRTCLIVIFMTFSLLMSAQSSKERASELTKQAVKNMDKGNIKEALKMLADAQKLDPDNIIIPYEMAFAHYLDKNYKEAIKILKPLTSHSKVYDRVYQMLGNCYDMDKKSAKAVETYDAGLKRFPKSGILHLERGNMELKKKEYNKALFFYEEGILADPTFPSNYYWASKLYLSSSNKVWGMIYGELFMNIERNSARTVELSSILYEVYSKQIKFESDTSVSVSFCKETTIYVDANDLKDPENFKLNLPYSVTVYEPTLTIAVAFEKKIDLASLNRIRTKFIELYYNGELTKDYKDVVLFQFHKKMIELGHFEAYNYWILMKGDEKSFNKWIENHESQWNGFVEWFTENPLEITEENFFHTTQYK